jgi:beta-xylosidase
MKKYFTLFLLAQFCIGFAQQGNEIFMFSYFRGNGSDGLHLAYSYDGLSWTALKNDSTFLEPEAGRDKLMRDPCIITGPDNRFHMVWTVSWFERGIGYDCSPDLLNWSEQKYIPVMEHEKEARNCWAPELFYDEDKEEFMIYWATTIPGRFPDTDALGDQNLNHRLYFTTTKNFIDFADTKLLLDPGFNVIDAVIIKEGNEYIMFLKNETLKPVHEKNIRISKSKYLTHGWGEVSEPITPHWCEGPTVIKINGKWIVYYDMYRKHTMGAVMSEDLINWKDITDKLKFPDGTRHGTVFKTNASIFQSLR